MTHNAPDESLLHAYADDQLADAERERVAAWLARNPQAAADVASWAEQRTLFHDAFDPVMDEPLPDALLNRIDARQPANPGRWRMAAAIGWLAIGLFGGYLVGHQAGQPDASLVQSPIVRDAAMAYAVYTPEVRHPVEVGADQREHLVAWLSKRVGGHITAPDLQQHGYSLIGGRLIASHDGPGALLMYEDPTGQRLTLFICHEEEATETAFRFAQAQDVNVFYWVDGPLGYALTGPIPREELQAVAISVYQALNP